MVDDKAAGQERGNPSGGRRTKKALALQIWKEVTAEGEGKNRSARAMWEIVNNQESLSARG